MRVVKPGIVREESGSHDQRTVPGWFRLQYKQKKHPEVDAFKLCLRLIKRLEPEAFVPKLTWEQLQPAYQRFVLL